MNLEGKNCVVVGAEGELGDSIATRYLEAGAAVESIPVAAVQSSFEVLRDTSRQVGDMVRELSERGDGIDVLVNAAWGHHFSLIEETDDDAWLADIERNLGLTFRTIRAAVPAMKARRTGAILNISSTAKDGVPWFAHTGHATHAAARGGVCGLTRALAYELGAHGIRVNCIVAGPIRTAKASRVFDKLAEDNEAQAQPEGMIALQRMGSPSDVANAAVFLASDASGFITGASLYVSGGLYG